jgi:hypothetical protein
MRMQQKEKKKKKEKNSNLVIAFKTQSPYKGKI